MDDLDLFRHQVETYLSTASLTPTAFGEKAAGDPNFVFELRQGREPRRATIAKVRGYMLDRLSPVARETAAEGRAA